MKPNTLGLRLAFENKRLIVQMYNQNVGTATLTIYNQRESMERERES